MRPLIMCSLALVYCAAPASAEERASGVGHELQRRGSAETPAKSRKPTDVKPEDGKSVENRPAQSTKKLGDGSEPPAQAEAPANVEAPVETAPAHDAAPAVETVPLTAALPAADPAPAVEAALRDPNAKDPEIKLAAPDEQKAIDMALKPFDGENPARKTDAAPAAIDDAAPARPAEGPTSKPADEGAKSVDQSAAHSEAEAEAPAKSAPAPTPVAAETPPAPPTPPAAPASDHTPAPGAHAPPGALDWMIGQARALEPLYALVIAVLVVGISAALTLLLRSRSGRPGQMLDQGGVLGDLPETTGAPKNNRTPPHDQ